jgi:hypothetical protein
LLYVSLVADATKTTFFVSDSRRAALKSIAVERQTTVTALLSEGADLVIEKYRGLADEKELARRAASARATLRAGLYEGPPAARKVDAVLYPTRRRKR